MKTNEFGVDETETKNFDLMVLNENVASVAQLNRKQKKKEKRKKAQQNVSC